MLPSGRARLRTHFLSTPMNLSNGNMLCRNTSPRISISFTRCTRRCVMMLKKDGGNISSKPTRHCTTSFCNFIKFSGSIIFYETALRKAHIFTMVNRKSWDLRFVNFFSAKFKIPFILDEYPDGTFILRRQNLLLHCLPW